MKLSEHFSLEELTASETATSKECLRCKKVFYKNKCRRWNKRKYCSKSCGGLSSTKAVWHRLLEKFTVNKVSGCWDWIGKLNHCGYSKFGNTSGHRAVYKSVIGKIPEGFQLDHLCRNRICVNPHHLEPVTPRENTLRGFGPSAINAQKTHCNKGHEFTEENTQRFPSGHGRTCRICHIAKGRRSREKKKALCA